MQKEELQRSKVSKRRDWHKAGRSNKLELREHFFFSNGFQYDPDRLFLTAGQARKAMVEGNYYDAIRKEKNRKVESGCRKPDVIFQNGFPVDQEMPLVGLTQREAYILCRVCGDCSRLATEKEADLILSEMRSHPGFWNKAVPRQIWTDSRYHPLSYAFCAYNSERKRWESQEPMGLPELTPEESGLYSLLSLDFEYKQVGERKGMNPSEAEKVAGAMIVYHLNKMRME